MNQTPTSKISVSRNWKSLIIAIIPIIVFGYVVFLRYNNVATLDKIAGEDKLFENLQALIAFLAIIPSGILAYKNRRNRKKLWLYSILSIGLFVFSMEEISWGQRIFDWESSEFFVENNNQNETTLHNMKSFAFLLNFGYLIIGFVGSVLSIFPSLVNKLKLSFFREIIPKQKHFSYFFIILIVQLLYWTFRRWDITWWTSHMNVRELETTELIFTIAVFLILSEQAKKQLAKQQ